MKRKSIRFLLPEISANDILFCYTFNLDGLISIICIIGILLWRAQISNSQYGQINKESLQKLPSIKFTARLFRQNWFANKFIASAAINKSSIFDAELYQSLDSSGRMDFIKMRIDDLVLNKYGDSKLLSPHQICDDSYLRTHRRGLVSSICGIFASNSLYHPGSLVSGINVSTLTWSDFADGFLNLCDFVGINNVEQELRQWAQFNLQISDFQTISFSELIKEIFVNGLLSNIKKPLLFEDGIFVSESQDNKTPLEEPINIIRNRPNLIKDIYFVGDSEDPFLSSAAEQIKLIKIKDRNFLRSNFSIKFDKKIRKKRNDY